MKKIITLALAAATVLGASAVSPKVFSLKDGRQLVGFEVNKTFTANGLKSQQAVSVNSRADELTPIKTGDFKLLFNMEDQEGNFQTYSADQIPMTKTDNGYALGIKMLTDNDNPLPFEPVEVQDEVVWGMPSSYLLVGGVELSDGSKVDLYPGCAVLSEDGQGGITFEGGSSEAQPIFGVTDDGQCLQQLQYRWQGLDNAMTGLGWFGVMPSDGKTYCFKYVFNFVPYMPNATWDAVMEEEADNGDCYAYLWKLQDGGDAFSCYGLYGFGNELNGTVDKANGEVDAYPSLAMMANGQELFFADPSSSNMHVAGRYEEVNGKAEIAFPNLNVVDGYGTEMILASDVTIVLNGGNEGAIEGVAADNTNAPVEYFNLQGQRIDQPAAGQVVIRRQGTEASKVLVK